MLAWVVGRDRLVGEGEGRDLLDAVDAGLEELDREVDGADNLLTAGDLICLWLKLVCLHGYYCC